MYQLLSMSTILIVINYQAIIELGISTTTRWLWKKMYLWNSPGTGPECYQDRHERCVAFPACDWSKRFNPGLSLDKILGVSLNQELSTGLSSAG